MSAPLFEITRKDGGAACGECHLRAAGETCDICGAGTDEITCPDCYGRCEVEVQEDHHGNDRMPCPTCHGDGVVERLA